MKRNVLSTLKSGLLLSAGALLLATAAPATAGFAQSGYSGNNTQQLDSRLSQIENQIQTLSRSVYRGEKMPAGTAGSADNSGAISNFEVRLSQIENQIRDMNGRIEQLGHETQQAKDRLEKMSADYEMRFQQQAGGAVGPSAPSSPSSSYGTASGSRAELTGDLYAGNSQPPKILGTLSSSGADPASLLYESAFADVRAAKYDTAETKFKDFMAKYPTHALAANAQYWLAETYYVRGDYNQAAKFFAQGYQDFPQGQKAADSLLKLGLSLAKIGKKDDACLSFQQLKKQFPGDQSTVGARALQEMKQIGCK